MLEGKVIVVTGGAKGIGRGCAQVMAGKGATIVIADNDEQAGPQAEAELQQSGAQALFVPTDVSQSEPVTEMVEHRMRLLDETVSSYAIVPPKFPSYPQVEDTLWETVQAAIVEELTVEEALSSLEREVTEIVPREG